MGFGNAFFSGFSVDPTRAIRAHLKEIVRSKDSMPIADFVDSISTRLPVLDNGFLRRLVEEKIDDTKWDSPKTNELSTALSLALQRLNEDGSIKLENKADAKEKRVLLGKGNSHLELISHIRKGENLA